MIAEVAAAAKRELGERILVEPVRVSCAGCGGFLVTVFVIPNLVRGRCSKCKVDIIALVNVGREVLLATDR